MEQQQSQQIRKYIDLVLRRKKMITSLVMIAIFVGLGVYLKTPKVYQSTALMIYERGKINAGSTTRISPQDVTTEMGEMVATLTQQVTSRTSLEAIIKQFDLYPAMRQKLPMEDVVDFMRSRNIVIQPDKGDVFKVSFNGDEPKKVMQVANAIAARFIEENLRYREEKATATSAYVGDELELSKTVLDKKEEVMRDYKLKYYNEMPQQLLANSTRLTALQTQLQSNRINAQELERNKIMIQEQISKRKAASAELASQVGAGTMVSTQQAGANPALVELAQARQQLAAARLRYTDSHPEVRQLQKKVATLEGSQGPPAGEPGNVADGVSEGRAAQTQTRSGSLLHDNQLEQLELQLKQADLAMESLNQENEGLKKQIDQYEKWLSMTPVREAEWTALTRDYDQLSKNYQQLVGRNLEAGAAESLERRQKGSQFKIVDSAYLPEKPIKPDFTKIMLMALAVGLGLGGGLAFLLELQDSSFRDVLEVENYLGVPVICAIPLIVSDKDNAANRRRSLAWLALLFISVLLLLGGMAYLYKTGRIII